MRTNPGAQSGLLLNSYYCISNRTTANHWQVNCGAMPNLDTSTPRSTSGLTLHAGCLRIASGIWAGKNSAFRGQVTSVQARFCWSVEGAIEAANQIESKFMTLPIVARIHSVVHSR